MTNVERQSLVAVVLMTAGLPVGCYSTSLLQETKPLAPGSVRAALGFPWHAERNLSPEAGLRVGLTDALEARIKGAFTGLEAGVNAQVVETDAVRLNVLPQLRWYGVTEDGDELLDETSVPERDVQAIAMPVILSAKAGDDVDFFLGPDLHAGLRDGQGFFAAGGNFGMAIDYGEHVTFMLECSMLWGVAGVDPAPSTLDDDYYDNSQSWMTVGDFSGQCGPSVSFGGKHATKDEGQPR